MPAVEVGRICVKISGRESGRKCVVMDVIDENFVLICGPKKLTGIKSRRVNIKHIEPTGEKISIKKGVSEKEVEQALKEAGKVDFVKEPVKPAFT